MTKFINRPPSHTGANFFSATTNQRTISSKRLCRVVIRTEGGRAAVGRGERERICKSDPPLLADALRTPRSHHITAILTSLVVD